VPVNVTVPPLDVDKSGSETWKEIVSAHEAGAQRSVAIVSVLRNKRDDWIVGNRFAAAISIHVPPFDSLHTHLVRSYLVWVSAC